ncbi:hypothetical protein [Pseudorhodoferax sp. Leaf265]|uniref:hypothetical protein n=1 Tax=Pseudorhodoferax sp. Leaf265 TaxID=1736315 RepID=UPI0012E97DF2|nr:hypothetical protein [Pseudorhodoferax sp. Leaf265]
MLVKRKSAVATILAGVTAVVSAAMLVGCAGRPTGYLSIEERITARGGVGENGVFHDALYNPEAIALQFPGYIVGLDKGRRASVLNGAELPPDDPSDSEGLKKVKSRVKGDPKVHYVSHVLRSSGQPFGQGNCTLYSMYGKWGNAADADPSDLSETPGEPCKSRYVVGSADRAFQDSRLAIGALQEEIGQQLASGKANYTHLLVVVMGWNTEQIEAVRNFNSVVSHIKTASREADFRPLFIGVTWSSSWSANWFEPAVKGISYVAKAHDADEVGATWIAEILDAVRPHVPLNMPMIAIGHSFGSRTLVSALCAGSAFKSAKDRQPRRSWDLFIAWQGAFSIHRMEKDGSGDGFSYQENCQNDVRSIVMTASQHDKANDQAFWADMAGSIKSWRETCPPEGGLAGNGFHCISSRSVRNTSIAALPLDGHAVTYLDASNVVFFNQPNTGGGAHSDIYRAVHGRLNWQLIQSATLKNQATP